MALVFRTLNWWRIRYPVPILASNLCSDYSNLVYACHNCNQRKGNKPLPSPDKVAYRDSAMLHLFGAKIVRFPNKDGHWP
jgi:hypothetical protein